MQLQKMLVEQNTLQSNKIKHIRMKTKMMVGTAVFKKPKEKATFLLFHEKQEKRVFLQAEKCTTSTFSLQRKALCVRVSAPLI